VGALVRALALFIIERRWRARRAGHRRRDRDFCLERCCWRGSARDAYSFLDRHLGDIALFALITVFLVPRVRPAAAAVTGAPGLLSETGVAHTIWRRRASSGPRRVLECESRRFPFRVARGSASRR